MAAIKINNNKKNHNDTTPTLELYSPRVHMLVYVRVCVCAGDLWTF